jgi:trans-2,3-dihydro-3-hydroxyanthranilate isomerase
VPFLYVPLRSLDAARRARPRADLIERASEEHGIPGGVFVFTREVEHEGSTVHSRMFAPGLGITEDPATGGASGPLGCYLVRHGVLPAGDIVSEQGIEMGRPSFIHIRIENEGERITAVRVGGGCHFAGEGFIEV